MEKKGSIFSLIKSLNKAEKRHFATFTGKENTNYRRLFEAIARQEVYDEAALKAQFKGEKFTAQLHVAKSYLQELILKSLRNFSANDSIGHQIKALLMDVEILFDRELFDLCRVRLAKAKKLSVQFERFPLLLEVINWERTLALNWQAGLSNLQAVIDMDTQVLRSLNELNHYWSLTANTDVTATRKLTTTLSATNPSSLRARILHHHLLFSSYLYSERWEQSEDELKTLIALLESHKEFIRYEPGSYVTSLGNLVSTLIQRKKYHEIPPLISKMREVPVQYSLRSDNKFTMRLWIRLFNLELELYRDTKDLVRGLKLIEEASIYLNQREKLIPQDYQLMLYYQFAHFFMMNKDFSRALHWVSMILGKNFGSVRDDIQIYARLMNLMVHFDLGNIIVLRYAVDSCRRFLKKKKQLSPQLAEILRFFGKLSHAPLAEHKSLFEEMNRSLAGVDHDHFLAEDYLDLRQWIRVKLKLQ